MGLEHAFEIPRRLCVHAHLREKADPEHGERLVILLGVPLGLGKSPDRLAHPVARLVRRGRLLEIRPGEPQMLAMVKVLVLHLAALEAPREFRVVGIHVSTISYYPIIVNTGGHARGGAASS